MKWNLLNFSFSSRYFLLHSSCLAQKESSEAFPSAVSIHALFQYKFSFSNYMYQYLVSIKILFLQFTTFISNFFLHKA